MTYLLMLAPLVGVLIIGLALAALVTSLILHIKGDATTRPETNA